MSCGLLLLLFLSLGMLNSFFHERVSSHGKDGSMRDESVFLPPHTIHSTPLNFKGKPPPGSSACSKYSGRKMGSRARAPEQLCGITLGWPGLVDGPVYSLQITSRMDCGEGWEGCSGSTFTFVVV